MDIPASLAVTGRVRSWLENPSSRLPVSCTVFVVDDDMESPEGIEASWAFTSKALRNAAGVAVHLSKLRPKGTDNGKGLVASGPVSFARLYSALNEVLRRGGTYKNGAVTLHLDYDHPDALEFVTTGREVLPWAKRALNVDDQFLNWPHLELAMRAMQRGDLWLVKKVYDTQGQRVYHNVCVSGDTLVLTDQGPKAARDLVGRPFTAIVNGTAHPSTQAGFWSNGFRQVVEVSTREGYSVRVTPDHKLLTASGWKQADELVQGEKLLLNEHRTAEALAWGGIGDFDQGWLLGWLLGDGTYASADQAKLDFYGSKAVLLNDALQRIQTLDHMLQGHGHYSEIRTGHSSKTVDRKSVGSVALAKLAEQFAITRDNKTATELLDQTSSEFHQGFIQAYFDADGTVNRGQASGAGRCLSVTSVNLCNLELLQRMLLRFGIRARIWKNRYNGDKKMMPDGKGGKRLYQTQLASRLDISSQIDLRRFHDLIGFSLPEKQEKLEQLLASYGRRAAYYKPFEATVQAVTACGVEEVFDCTIPGVHEFDANGLRAHNCLEVNLPHKGTCLLSHVNLGAVTVAEIPQAFTEGMQFLCQLHSKTGVGDSGIYLSPEQDKQVGLGVLGLANLLAAEGVSYKEFVEALEGSNTNEVAVGLRSALKAGFASAAAVAKAHGMERAFAIAPTATCSYQYKDRRGYTTCPEISPPIGRSVDRDSTTFGVASYDYPPNVEVAEEVGWDVYFRLQCEFQRLMDETGLAHAMSTNWWSDMVQCDRDFIKRFLDSPLKSLYYSLQVMQGTQDKSELLGGDEIDYSILGLDVFPPIGQSLPDATDFSAPCVGCAE
jgi:ribonucleotide reductase alpha subunit